MSDLSEWKLAVVTDLVLKVVPTNPEDAKPWEDVAVRAVYEYERTRESWQTGDPNFDIYQDNFIRKEYIFNRRNEIRTKLIQERGIVLMWNAGRSYTGIWRDDTEDAMRAYLETRRKNIGGQADGYNSNVDAGAKLHDGLTMPVFEQVRRLPSTNN